MHRTLVVGVASRGGPWINAVKAHEKFELSGLADLNAEILVKRGEESGIRPENRHLTLEDALGSGKYDVAVVVTPNHIHYPVTKQILGAGVHCLLEKPFTEEYAHAEELVRLAEDKKLVLEIGQNYRFKPICRFVAEFIRGQKLGRLSGIEASFHRHRPPRFEHERVMRFPMLYLQAIHHLDWMLSILPSPVVEVFSRHRRAPWSEWREPSICHFVLRCQDDVMVSYRGSYESQGEITPFDGLWRFEFERGDLLINGNRQVVQVTERGEKTDVIYAVGEDESSGEAELLDGMDEAIVGGVEPPTSGRRNLETLKMLFKIFGQE